MEVVEDGNNRQTESGFDARKPLLGHSIRRHLAALIVCSVVPLLCVLTYVVTLASQVETERAEREARELAESVGAVLDLEWSKLEASLVTLSEILVFPDQDLKTYHQAAQAFSRHSGAQLLMVDPLGRVIDDSQTAWGQRPRPQTLPPDAQAALQNGRVLISDKFPSASGQSAQVALVVPIIHDGHSRFALVAMLDVQRIGQWLREMDLQPQWSTMLVDGQQQSLWHRNSPHEATSAYGLIDEPATQTTRFTHSLEKTRWQVVVDVSRADLQQPYVRSFIILSLAGTLAFLLSISLAMRTSRKVWDAVKAVDKQALRLGQGEEVEPLQLGIKELQVLSDAIVAADQNVRAARAAALASETRLRLAMEAASMVAFTLDAELQCTWFYSSAHEDIGCEDLLGTTELGQLVPQSAAVLHTLYQRALSTGQSLRQDVTVQIRSRLTHKHLDLTLTPMFDADDAICGVIGVAIDISERKATEDRLRESQEDLNRAQAVARTGSWRVNVWTNELIWSDENWRIFGIPKREYLTYANFLEMVHPEDRDYVAQRWNEALHGRPYDIDHRILVGNQVRWVRERANLEYDDQGVLLGGFGTTQDITERKLLEEEIRQREQYLRAVIDNLPFMLWLKDERSRFLAVNTRFATTFGWPSPESLVGKSDLDVAPLVLAMAYRDDDREVLESGISKNTEELVKTNDEYRWHETYKSPVILDGRIIGTVGYARDISHRRAMELRLRESEAFNLAVLNSLVEHIAVLDERGIIVAVNTAWQQFARENGAPELAEHSVGRPYRSPNIASLGQYQDTEAETIWNGIDQVLSGELSRFTHEYACDAPGEARYFRVNAYPLPVPRRGAVVSHENITGRKQAEAALKQAMAKAEQANNAKSRFLAAASHDLRQPLSALALYVGMLGGRLGQEDAALLRNMKDCLASLNELLANLLDLSMLEAGVTKPEISDFRLIDVFSRVVSIHTPEADLKELTLRCTDTNFIVRSDPVLFGRMLRNVVANAVRYTERGGVLVGCRRHRGKYWVEVWDTGIGIPCDKTQEIFEEFKQLGNDERNRGKGSGLGLAIVAKTASLLGVEVRVRSRLGKGSMFALELPPGAAVDEVLDQDLDYRPLWIGLVENDPDVIEALTYALEAQGHQVVPAGSGAELMELIDGLAPDVVISDYRLDDGETGFDVITRLRSHFRIDIPALIITGDTDPQVMRRMANQGIRVLHKPLDLENLLRCLAQLTADDGASAARAAS